MLFLPLYHHNDRLRERGDEDDRRSRLLPSLRHRRHPLHALRPRWCRRPSCRGHAGWETSLNFRVYLEFLLYKFKQLPPPQRWPGVVIRSTHWSGQKGWGSWEQERLNFFFPKHFLSSSCHIVTGVSSFHPTECPHIRCSSSLKNWAPSCWSGQSLPSSFFSALELCSLLSGRWENRAFHTHSIFIESSKWWLHSKSLWENYTSFLLCHVPLLRTGFVCVTPISFKENLSHSISFLGVDFLWVILLLLHYNDHHRLWRFNSRCVRCVSLLLL